MTKEIKAKIKSGAELDDDEEAFAEETRRAQVARLVDLILRCRLPAARACALNLAMGASRDGFRCSVRAPGPRQRRTRRM